MPDDKAQEEVIRQQEAEQAPVPPAPNFIRQAIKEARSVSMEVKDSDDKVMAEGADSDFWRILKRFIDSRIKTLEDLTSQKITSGNIDLQDVGLRYLISDQVTHALKEVIQFVELRQQAQRHEQEEVSAE